MPDQEEERKFFPNPQQLALELVQTAVEHNIQALLPLLRIVARTAWTREQRAQFIVPLATVRHNFTDENIVDLWQQATDALNGQNLREKYPDKKDATRSTTPRRCGSKERGVHSGG